jgi:hypothetical protein
MGKQTQSRNLVPPSSQNAYDSEPEFRLLLLPIGAVVFASGMIGYGWGINAGLNVYGCNVLNGMMLGGGMICSTSVIVYALDAYRDSSNEIFIMNMFFKNFIYYGLSYFVNNWAASDGAGSVFSVFGGTGFGLVIPPFRVSLFRPTAGLCQR